MASFRLVSQSAYSFRCKEPDSISWNGKNGSSYTPQWKDAKRLHLAFGNLRRGTLMGMRRAGPQRERNRFSRLPHICQGFPGDRPNEPTDIGSSTSTSSSSLKRPLSILLMRASTPDHLLAAATLRAQLLYEYPSGSGRNNASNGNSAGDSEVQCTSGAFGPMEEAIVADMYGLRLKNEFDRDLSFRLVNAHVDTYLAICPWERMAHTLRFPAQSNSTSLLLTPPQLDSSLTTLPDGAAGGVYAAVATLDIDMAEDLFHMGSRPWGRAIHHAMGVGADVPQCANRMETQRPRDPAAVSGGAAYIFNLCVTPAMRRQGVGHGLLSFALGDLLKQGTFSSIHVHVEVSNNAAINLYSSVGFRLVHEESLEDAEKLQRPRRSLFSFYPVNHDHVLNYQ